MIIDAVALGNQLTVFKAKLGGFQSFSPAEGGYFECERSYKDDLIASFHGRFDTLIAEEAEGMVWFKEMLDFLKYRLPSTGKPQNFVTWQIIDHMSKAPSAWQSLIGDAVAKLLISDDRPQDLFGSFWTDWEAAASLVHEPFVVANLNASEGRIHSIAGLLLALQRPNEAVIVRPKLWQTQANLLAKDSLFKQGASPSQNYLNCLAFAQALFLKFRELNLAPKDLWDVQGFLWVLDKFVTPDEITLPNILELPNMTHSHPLNLILHGPPGTGKTYATAKIAVEMCGEIAPNDRLDLMAAYHRLCEAGRIEFVTFHQSFAYEDFVEGLRPEQIEGGAGFELKPTDGVLKRIAAKAAAVAVSGTEPGFNVSGREIFKMSLGRAFNEEDAYLFEDCINNNYVGLGYGGDVDFSDETFASYANIRDHWRGTSPDAVNNDPNIQLIYALRGWMKEGDLVVISEGNLRFRAIGVVTGPYEFEAEGAPFYKHRRSVRWLWQTDQALPYDLIQKKKFSQVSLYNLGNAGLKLEALQDLLTPKIANNAAPLPHVLIIDEINRANVSKTFGELITLLEDDKRLGATNQLKVRLPYSGETFGLPSNLHVLGTMNTADRSIALLDTALRRRFDFQEIMPEPDVLDAVVESVAVSAILRGLNARIEWLYDRDHLIGHAWLMGADSDEALSQRFKTKIIPLLQEYFHENWDNVRAALGETSATARFVSKTLLTPPPGFEGASERYHYRVLDGPYGAVAWAQIADNVTP